MAAQIVSFFQRTPRHAPSPIDWSQQELAEFYRVESALTRAGISVGVDRGLSDEGEPWFIFFRADDGEVVIHFARIDGQYLIAGPAYEEIARGHDFSSLVRNMLARHPLVRKTHLNDNVSIHPAALLIAIVGTAFFKTGEARASETRDAPPSRPTLLFGSASSAAVQAAAPQHIDTVQIPVNQAVLILAAALLTSDYSVQADSMDSATLAAIQAAAATLDFGDAPRGLALTGEPVSTSASALHVASFETAAAQHISSVLSLVAVLSSMPQEHAAAAPSEAALWFAPTRHEPIFNAVTAPVESHEWSISVQLGAGGLPSVEAVQLVSGFLGDGTYKKISVIEVTKLPDVLADLIKQGPHVFTPSTPLTPDPVAPASPATGEVGQGDTAGQGGGGGTAVVPAPVVPAPVVPGPVYSSPELVKQFIDYFLSHTAGVEVMTHGPSIVIFDARVLHDVSTIVQLTSLTFDFADGGSISLVGSRSAFLNHDFLI